MRKWIILSLIVVLILSLSINAYAKRAALIDFSKLKANGDGIDTGKSLAEGSAEIKDYTNHDAENRRQHLPTLLDYSSIAGSNYTEDEIKGMGTSLSAYNWDVILNSSAAHVKNQKYSYAIEWHTKYVPVLAEEQKEGESKDTPEGYNVLGVRIHFMDAPFNNWALIQPPFEIPGYENKDVDYQGNKLSAEDKQKPENVGTKYDNGYGVLKNVGNLKTIDVRVYGCQFKNSLAILVKDDMNIVNEYHFPQYLDFDGWRKLTWKNPNYIEEAANRDLYVVPLYPRSMPYVKFSAFRIYRQGDQYGGDFVTYFKDVYVTYDEAVLERDNVPIEHELAWGIIQARTIEAKAREMRKIGHDQVLRYLERKKMHQETSSN